MHALLHADKWPRERARERATEGPSEWARQRAREGPRTAESACARERSKEGTGVCARSTAPKHAASFPRARETFSEARNALASPRRTPICGLVCRALRPGGLRLGMASERAPAEQSATSPS
eukprot:2560630-Pleurochrysis_carterae.AAC.1